MGGLVVAGGVATGVVLALNNVSVVRAEKTDLTLDPNSKQVVLDLVIDDETKTNNATENSAIVFQTTKTDHANFTVNRKKISATLAIDNIPTLKGKYVYHFDVTLVYNKNDNTEIRREVKGLTVTYDLAKDWVDITDPAKRMYDIKLEDKEGTGHVTVGEFKYHGDIDESNFAVKIANEEDIKKNGINMSSFVSIDDKKKTFSVNTEILDGINRKHQDVVYDFYYNGEVVHNTRIVFALEEADTITAAATKYAVDQMHWDRSANPQSGTARGTYYGFGYTGLSYEEDPVTQANQIYQKLRVAFNAEDPRQFTIKDGTAIALNPKTGEYEIAVHNTDPRSKTFDLTFDVTFDSPDDLKETNLQLEGLLKYRYDDKVVGRDFGTVIGGDDPFVMRLSEGRTISAPETQYDPISDLPIPLVEYITLQKNGDTYSLDTRESPVISGFRYTGFEEEELDNAPVTLVLKHNEGTEDEPSLKEYHFTGKITNVAKPMFDVEITGIAESYQGRFTDAFIGRKSLW